MPVRWRCQQARPYLVAASHLCQWATPSGLWAGGARRASSLADVTGIACCNLHPAAQGPRLAAVLLGRYPARPQAGRQPARPPSFAPQANMLKLCYAIIAGRFLEGVLATTEQNTPATTSRPSPTASSAAEPVESAVRPDCQRQLSRSMKVSG